MENKFTFKKRFAYLPVLVWDVPAIKGRYYRFIWLKHFYTIQKNNRWMFIHTYADKFTASQRTISLNGGYEYKNGQFVSRSF